MVKKVTVRDKYRCLMEAIGRNGSLCLRSLFEPVDLSSRSPRGVLRSDGGGFNCKCKRVTQQQQPIPCPRRLRYSQVLRDAEFSVWPQPPPTPPLPFSLQCGRFRNWKESWAPPHPTPHRIMQFHFSELFFYACATPDSYIRGENLRTCTSKGTTEPLKPEI